MMAVYSPATWPGVEERYTGVTEFGRADMDLLHGLLFKRIDQWQAGVDNPAGRRRGG